MNVHNRNIKFYKCLRLKKYILENKCYIVEGDHLVKEALNAGLLQEVLRTKDYSFDDDISTTILSFDEMENISLLKSVPEIMGIVKLEDKKEIIGEKIVLLDNVQDPGNVGTIIRCALAFNVSTVILSDDSVSLFNDKMIRASEGTIFNVNVIRMDLRKAIDIIKKRGIGIYYADAQGNIDLDSTKLERYALVLGSEGQGVSSYIKELSEGSISVPINNLCESLNVSVCGGIIMYKFR